MMDVQISVNLTRDQYRSMTAIADKRHTQVHALIEQLVTHALQPKPASVQSAREAREAARAQLAVDVRRLHGTGRTDRQIAENLGAKRSQVSYLRAQMNLASHDPRGRKKSTTNQIESTTA